MTILEMAHSLCNVAVGFVERLCRWSCPYGGDAWFFRTNIRALLRRPYPAIGSHQVLMCGAAFDTDA